MGGFKQLTAAMEQKATIEQLEHVFTMVDQKATNERSQLLTAVVDQKAAIEQLEHISAIVEQKAANEGFQHFKAAVKQKATIEQLEHISIMVEQKATNERSSAAHCGCGAKGDDTAARGSCSAGSNNGS